MTRRGQGVALGVLAVCFSALVGVACGDDGGSEENVGATGGSAGAAGSGSDNGGSSNAGSSNGGSANAGTNAGGSANGGSANGGTGGTSSVALGNPDDVIGAVCDWEFRCCDAGERRYRLSPFATDAATCKDRLTFEMRDSNGIDNPYVSGPGAPGGILGILGYVVDLTRVEVSAEGVQACKDHWDSLGCAEEADPDARCEPDAPADPCALTNLFRPVLQIGDRCTPALTEGISNDVECVVGSTCLDVGDPDNPNAFPTCVQRGLAGADCSQDNDCDFNFFCGAGTCTEKSDATELCSFNDVDDPVPGDEDIQCKAGLSCNPTSLTCVPSCTLGFTCATNGGDNDLACPANSGCAPVLVDGGTTAFRVCAALGTTAAARCNNDADCEANRYCDGTVCQADLGNNDPCTQQKECGTGQHCDVGVTGTCINNLNTDAACTDDFQCGPDSAGCLNGTAGLACLASKLANGQVCGENDACVSSRCELATVGAATTTCVAGAAASAACDAITADGQALSCGEGLLCFGDTGAAASGTCVAQATAGVSCDNPDGNVDNAMCANGVSCDVGQWELDICTDGAIADTNGGSGLTCDGNNGT